MWKDIATLKERWLELYPEFTDFREVLLAKVVRWECANGPRYDPRPYYFQREFAKGRLLRRLSADSDNSDGIWKCGYDNQNRMVVSRFHRETWETIYYNFTDNYIELASFQTHYHILRGISRLYFHDTQPSYFISFNLQGDPEEFQGVAQEIWGKGLQGKLSINAEREDYHYSNTQLRLIELRRWHSGYQYDKHERLFEMEYSLDYDSDGNLERILYKTLPSDFARTVYRKRQTGETLLSLTLDAKSSLINVIPKVIQRAHFSEPLYCLQLHYLDGSFFPPYLLPGFESRRQRIQKTLEPRYIPAEAWANAWDFTEHEDESYPPLPIEEKETLSMCEILQTEVTVRGNFARYRHSIKTLRQIAQALNQLDWSKYAPVTPDFIVFAYDQEDISRALRMSGATHDQISSWRERGLL